MTQRIFYIILFLTAFTSQKNFAKIIFIDGLPASGKSSLARELLKVLPQEKSPQIIESDAIAEEMAKKEGTTPKWLKSTEIALRKAKELSAQGKLVILDSFLSQSSTVYQELKKDNAFIILVYAPLEILMKRFQERNHAGRELPDFRVLNYYQDFFDHFEIKEKSSGQKVYQHNQKEIVFSRHFGYDHIAYSAIHSATELAKEVKEKIIYHLYK